MQTYKKHLKNYQSRLHIVFNFKTKGDRPVAALPFVFYDEVSDSYLMVLLRSRGGGAFKGIDKAAGGGVEDFHSAIASVALNVMIGFEGHIETVDDFM